MMGAELPRQLGNRARGIVDAALKAGSFRAEVPADVVSCRNLNGRQLLSRDPKDGALWYPTEKLRGLAGVEEPLTNQVGGDLSPAAEASDLVVAIESARALLDAGDVEAALLLSTGAYERAKAAATYAAKVKASRELIDKARRMQAEALKIESMCYVAMADAIDEAQAKGYVARQGRPEKSGQAKVRDADVFTFEDVGVDKRRLHEARKLRNAVRAEPDFVDRVVEARLESGLEPSRRSISHAIGTRSASTEEKGDQLYETSEEATRTVLALESFSAIVKLPEVGRGAILRVLEASGYEAVISDLRDYGTATKHGELQQVGDFLKSLPDGTEGMDMVINPPYGDVANAFLAHALREHKPRKMAALLNLNFMCGFEDPDRRFVMDENPPSRVYVFTRRLPMMHRDGWDGPKASSQMNTAWFVWERNDDGSYGRGNGLFETIRIDWQQYQSAPALAPGAGGHTAPFVFSSDDEDFTRETPRKSLDERCDEERARALIWMGERESFDAVTLRRGVGVRPSVADALIAGLSAEGLIEARDAEWVVSEAGWLALKAAAGVLLTVKAVAE
ncbi:hypothetical protein [Ensifer sp. LCM 4579]|uniref:hypothetical protein n=1 Tax=Ensifer sp. LCM 4579 TaxID=1848292 RepID=UPI0008D9F726|nr:hypothetical protein [Ensifer sp. LCM 4579]OHV85937.1 hypothetical protein LCM4579_00820 [Ensifer sp. LCM 4579]